jgi:hypothetical protein
MMLLAAEDSEVVDEEDPTDASEPLEGRAGALVDIETRFAEVTAMLSMIFLLICW